MGGHHCRAELGPLGEGGPFDVSACMVCDGVSKLAGAGWGWRGRVVQSYGPHPPRRQHRRGTPVLVSSETSGLSQQSDDAASGGEGRTPHRGSSDGVSCACGDRRQPEVSSSAGELSDRSVVDMKYGLGLDKRAFRPAPGRKTSHEGKPWGLTMAAGGMVMKVLCGMRGKKGGGRAEGERSSFGVDSGR
jgi:hypothetical protein